ncbi:unnamed protein product, partial [Tetraodon nigroviridis]
QDTGPGLEDQEPTWSADSEEDGPEKAGSDGDEGSGDGEERGDEADDDGEADDDDEGDGDDGGGGANAGWAEAMAKILAKKTPASKSAILLKNKELDKAKEKEKQEQLERKKQGDGIRPGRIPVIQPRLLRRICSPKAAVSSLFSRKGVVQLFNAVRKHQKTMEKKVKEAGGSERKKAKLLSSVSKKDFIHVLRRTEGDAGTASKTETETV